ncbi:MAG: hypothetical protein COB69_08735 [Phycisphaera sp.]|nr:MAG: hypothetical protein COB69_08735 [Phycisphaera sp.]
MQFKHFMLGACALAASSVPAQTNLVISINADTTTALPGDTVGFTIVAELLNPTGVVLAVIADMGFGLSFGGTDLIISNNQFTDSFDSDFFGPAADGVVSGDSIIGALGTNTLPPLDNAGGVDSSNPLLIYTFDVTVPLNTTQTSYSISDFALNGQVTGAYEGVPFPAILFYQDAQGNPGDTPWSLGGNQGFQVIPAPTSGLVLLGASLAATRRRR